MRAIRDRTGKLWEGTEIGAYGVGARGPGDGFPQATVATVVFSCEDGRKITRELAVGQLDKASSAELIAILEEPTQDEDE